jgi:hypothetical protein
MTIYNDLLVTFAICCGSLMSCGMKLGKGMLHIMTHSTRLSMVHRKVKGYAALSFAFALYHFDNPTRILKMLTIIRCFPTCGIVRAYVCSTRHHLIFIVLVSWISVCSSLDFSYLLCIGLFIYMFSVYLASVDYSLCF